MDLDTVTAVLRPTDRAALRGLTPTDGILGGGTWLFSEPQPGLRRLVDLTALGWTPLEADTDGLEIAATCRIATLHAWTPPPQWVAARLVPRCCEALLGSFKVWNAATVGGNIALALPAGPMIALAVALDGEAVIWTPEGGERRLAVIDLVIGDRCTSLRTGEILRAIRVSDTALRRRAAFRQMSLTPLGRSAALLIGTRDGRGDFALTITAATPRPVRLVFAALPAESTLRDAIEAAVTAENGWFDDVHGAPDWRRHITLRMAEEIRLEMEGSG